MTDLIDIHVTAQALYQAGLHKLAADLHFSGKLQVDSLGDLVLDVPSALLRGCLSAIKEPGVELYLGENWKSRIVVMHKLELTSVGGPRAITERGKDFDYKIGQSTTGMCGCQGQPMKVWQLDIVAPDLTKLRQSYGLTGEPEGGFRAIFGMRKPGLFRDGDKVTKDGPGNWFTVTPKPEQAKTETGGTEWTLKRSGALSAISKPAVSEMPATDKGKFPDKFDMASLPEGSHVFKPQQGSYFNPATRLPDGGQHSPLRKKGDAPGTIPGMFAGPINPVPSVQPNMSPAQHTGMVASSLGATTPKLPTTQVAAPIKPMGPMAPKPITTEWGGGFGPAAAMPPAKPLGTSAVPAKPMIAKAGDLNPGVQPFGKHIFVTGQSGSGKSTLAKGLADSTGMPIVTLDNDPRVKAFYRSDPDLTHTEPGSQKHKEWLQFHHDVVRDALANAKVPSIMDGTYFLNAPSNLTANAGHMVLLDHDRDTILQRRVSRHRVKRLLKGEPFDEATYTANSRKIHDVYQPSVDAMRARPGVIAVSGDAADPQKLIVGLRKQADLNPGVQLQPHQQALAEEIDPEHPARKLMMWQTGSGKTLGSMAAAEAYGQPYSVIGPAAIRPTFKSEQKKYTDMTLPSSIMSYQKAMKPEGIPHPDSMVIDEAQRIINPASRQSQAVQEAARKAKQVLLLSGTPIVNRPGDLAPILSVLTGNEITPGGFEARYMGQESKPRTWAEWLAGKDKQYDPVIRHRDELKHLLEGKVDYYAPNKPNVDTKYSDHEVEMGEGQTKLYQAMFGKIPWKLRLGLDQSTDMTPTQLQQLRSFMSGPRQVGLSDYPFASHNDPLKSFYGSTKLQLAFKNLQEKLNSDPRTKAIVYSNFPRAGLEPYRAILAHHNIPHTLFDGSLSDPERDASMRSFNEGRSRVALVGPAGAEGISLRGAQMAQLLDPHWNEARMRQATARGIRFDSHSSLPPELQNIEVQRYISKLPAKSRSWLQAMRLMPYSPQPQPAADDYLQHISDRKELANKLVMDLLKEVGTRPVQKQASKCTHEERHCSKCKTLVGRCRCLNANGEKTYTADPECCNKCNPDWLKRTIARRLAKESEDGKDKKMGGGSDWDRQMQEEGGERACGQDRGQNQEETHDDKGSGESPLQAIARCVAKSAKLVSIKIHDTCSNCGNSLSLLTANTHGSKHVLCSNCGDRNFVLTSEQHKKELIDAAAKETDTEVSQEQRQAGNYRKGKFGYHDLVIAIENPAGSTRSGTSKSGHKWSIKLQDHYGYILKHVSEADGDHVDVFVAAEPDFTNHNVYVIDQNVGGEFDEHKCVLLAKSAKDAKEIYRRNYSDGWKGYGDLSTLSLGEFTRWLREGDTGRRLFVKVPASDIAAAEVALARGAAQAKKIDKTGDDSGGGYGDTILCTRQKKAWFISGDWWSNEVCDMYKKELRKALPDYEIDGISEGMPSGWEKDNMGDWALVKHKG